MRDSHGDSADGCGGDFEEPQASEACLRLPEGGRNRLKWNVLQGMFRPTKVSDYAVHNEALTKGDSACVAPKCFSSSSVALGDISI